MAAYEVAIVEGLEGCDREFGLSISGATEGFKPEEDLGGALW